MKWLKGAAQLAAAVMLCNSPVAAQQTSDPTTRSQQPALDSLASAVRVLQARVDSLAGAGEESAAASQAAQAPSSAPVARAGGAYMNVSYDGLMVSGWSSESNVGSLQRGDHDPLVRGFTIPNAELALDGLHVGFPKGIIIYLLLLEVKKNYII